MRESPGPPLCPEHGTTGTELVRFADRALYIAKKGGDKIHIGEEEYQLDNSCVRVVFQPIVDVRLNQVIGYEALSRDTKGNRSILDLFKRYEAIGQLHELKHLWFSKQIESTRSSGIERMFINVDFKLLETLEPFQNATGVDVILDISESEALYEIEHRLAIAETWKANGFKFAIDDFGAGFVSLPFIAQLVPDYIKLDRATVVQAVQSGAFRRVLDSLLLGLRNCATGGIIAEGIETEEELQIVKQLGIYLAQGYLLGKPEERSFEKAA